MNTYDVLVREVYTQLMIGILYFRLPSIAKNGNKCALCIYRSLQKKEVYTKPGGCCIGDVRQQLPLRRRRQDVLLLLALPPRVDVLFFDVIPTLSQ